jgi:hypothetical protein
MRHTAGRVELGGPGVVDETGCIGKLNWAADVNERKQPGADVKFRDCCPPVVSTGCQLKLRWLKRGRHSWKCSCERERMGESRAPPGLKCGSRFTPGANVMRIACRRVNPLSHLRASTPPILPQ